jgi:hypothetical protein
MATSEGDQVFVGFLRFAEPFAQVRHRALFEGDHRSHRQARIRPRRLISYNMSECARQAFERL